MSDTINPPVVYWCQNDQDIFLRIGINDPEDTKVEFKDNCMQFSASDVWTGPEHCSYSFTLDFYKPTEHDENMYDLIDHQLQFVLKKKTKGYWPRLTSFNTDPPWIEIDVEKSEEKESNKAERECVFEKASEGFAKMTEKLHREDLEKRDVHEDYPHMYDELHKAELGYRKEDRKKVYLVLYNLCQFVGFIYILIIMSIRYSREGPDSMSETYNSVGGVMKSLQLLQFLEVLHPMFGYTKGNPFVALLQVGGRAFIVFCMLEAEPRMQTKPVVFYVFFIWSLVEIFRYPYYITQILNVEIPLLTWFRYTIWIPLYPLGFLCEGIIVLRNIPYFEETEKFTVAMPNSWNFAFHFPNFLRIYLLLLSIPGMYTMMSHMNRTRYKKLGKSKQRRTEKKEA